MQLIGELFVRWFYNRSMDRNSSRYVDQRHTPTDRRRYRNDQEYQDRKNHADLIERLIIGKITFSFFVLTLILVPWRRGHCLSIWYCLWKKKSREKKKWKKVVQTESYCYNYDYYQMLSIDSRISTSPFLEGSTTRRQQSPSTNSQHSWVEYRRKKTRNISIVNLLILFTSDDELIRF